METYNGHRSYNAWNVSLWINNDENLYNYSLDLIKQYGINLAVKKFLQKFDKTPDGAKYNRLSVLEAFKDLNS